MDPFKLSPRRSIASQLLHWFLAIGLLPTFLVAYLIDRNSEEFLLEDGLEDLRSVAERQDGLIRAHIDGGGRTLTALSRTEDVMQAVEAYCRAFREGGTGSVRYRRVDGVFGPRLESQMVFGLLDLFLISPDGDVVFTVRKGEDLGPTW